MSANYKQFTKSNFEILNRRFFHVRQKLATRPVNLKFVIHNLQTEYMEHNYICQKVRTIYTYIFTLSLDYKYAGRLDFQFYLLQPPAINDNSEKIIQIIVFF